MYFRKTENKQTRPYIHCKLLIIWQKWNSNYIGMITATISICTFGPRIHESTVYKGFCVTTLFLERRIGQFFRHHKWDSCDGEVSWDTCTDAGDIVSLMDGVGAAYDNIRTFTIQGSVKSAWYPFLTFTKFCIVW